MKCKSILLGIKPYFIHARARWHLIQKAAAAICRHLNQAQAPANTAILSLNFSCTGHIKYYSKVLFTIKPDCIQSKKHRLPFAGTLTGWCKQLLDLNLISSDVPI